MTPLEHMQVAEILMQEVADSRLMSVDLRNSKIGLADSHMEWARIALKYFYFFTGEYVHDTP